MLGPYLALAAAMSAIICSIRSVLAQNRRNLLRFFPDKSHVLKRLCVSNNWDVYALEPYKKKQALLCFQPSQDVLIRSIFRDLKTKSFNFIYLLSYNFG